MSAADSNTSLPEKKSGYTFGHNETLLLISLYQKYEVFFSDVPYKKKAIWQIYFAITFVYKTAKSFCKSKTVSLFSSSSLFTRKIAAIKAAMAASSSAAIFVTQCLRIKISLFKTEDEIADTEYQTRRQSQGKVTLIQTLIQRRQSACQEWYGG